MNLESLLQSNQVNLPAVSSNDQKLNEPDFPDYLMEDPEIVGYPDDDFQKQIYNWVLSDIPFDAKILDIGCGRGDIIKLLVDHEYYGIDLNDVIVNVGLTKYKDSHLRCIDFFDIDNERYDHIICIGSLNSDYGLFDLSAFRPRYDYLLNMINKGLEMSNVMTFVLLNSADEPFISFPISNVIELLSRQNIPFLVDYSLFKDIYKLVVYKAQS